MPDSVHCVLLKKGKVMLETMQRVHATLASFNEEREQGRVTTDCGVNATLNVSRLRVARLARREQDRVHRLDKRIIPGVKLVVDIETDSTGKAKVTTVHRLSERRQQLTDGSMAIGTVTWVPDKSYGFIEVCGVFDKNRKLNDVINVYENVFVHISEIRRDLIAAARVSNARLVFMVISNRERTKFQAKVIGIQE
jgi:cold shock CspA family protein